MTKVCTRLVFSVMLLIGTIITVGCSATSSSVLSQSEIKQTRLLLNQGAIESVIKAYALSMDNQDWDLHRSIFTDQYQLYRRGKFITESIDKRIERLSRFTQNYEWTQHLASIYSVDIQENTAFVVSSLQAKHRGRLLDNGRQTRDYTMIGQYHYWLVKEQGKWKINKMRVKRFRNSQRSQRNTEGLQN